MALTLHSILPTGSYIEIPKWRSLIPCNVFVIHYTFHHESITFCFRNCDDSLLQQVSVSDSQLHVHTYIVRTVSYTTVIHVVNPRRACAARVTVVGVCVCLSVCRRLFSHYRLRGGL